MTPAADYVIVGAGPAGLAAAGFVAKAGYRVHVYESRPRPDNVFGSYPVVLNARGLLALEQLDPALVRKAQGIGIPVDELHIVDGSRTRAEVPTYGTGIMRDQVAKLLLDFVESCPNVVMFWEHTLTGVDVANRMCAFRQASGMIVQVVAARLVAADGNRSLIRKTCETSVPGFSAEADDWGFQLRFMTSPGLPSRAEVDPAVHFVLGDKGYVCQQPDGVWSVSLRVLPGVDEDFLTADEATDKRVRKLRKYVAKHAPFAAEHLVDESGYRNYYQCNAFGGLVVKCSRLNPTGWICIIGDGAHAVQPATGEGINSGLEDAAVLGMSIREHPEDPFGSYDRRRRADAHALHSLALQARGLVVASPRDKFENVMVTIGLSIAKKLHVIPGVKQDYMLGARAKTEGVMPYRDLMEMDARQTRLLRPMAQSVATLLRISDVSPLDAANQEETDSERSR